jgi:hypothetical protein
VADLKPSKTAQPAIFWFTVVAAVVGFASAIPLLRSASGTTTIVFGIVIPVAITALIIGGAALAVSGRMAAARRELPNAVLIPIVVGPPMAASSADLAKARANTGFKLKTSSYATVAVDSSGLYFVKGPIGPWARIDAAEVEFAGFVTTVVGARAMNALVLRITATPAPIELLLVPMRLRGNVLKGLREAELIEVGRDIRAALHSQPARPGWRF